MKTLTLILSALLIVPASSRAQSIDIHVDLPAVLPRLVVVHPGVEVVPEAREEVFFHDGYYWVRRDHAWYRSRDHRGGWALVPSRRVPRSLSGIPPGKYRTWHAEKVEEHREVRPREKARGHEERREDHGDHPLGHEG